MTIMSSLRTTLVALVALAIAAFPVAGAAAYGVSSDAALVSAQSDCARHAQMGQATGPEGKSHQGKADHAKKPCGKLGACGGKCICLGLTAVLTTVSDESFSPMPLLKTARLADSALSLAYIPPSPPPRV